LSTDTGNGSELFHIQETNVPDHTGLSGAITEIKDVGAALWKEVYQHPAEAGLAVVGSVAVGALALYAGRNAQLP
jgi:hypothetical protein